MDKVSFKETERLVREIEFVGSFRTRSKETKEAVAICSALLEGSDVPRREMYRHRCDCNVDRKRYL